LADELRQSSDDCTRLGRTYVTTANAKYEKQYFEILDIRNGKKPRPLNYNRIYWDFYTVNLQKPRGDGPTVALAELMKEGGFTANEFGFLKQAQANSDGLVNLEVEAMNAVKGKFRDASGKYTVEKTPDLELARRLVHSEQYHKFKADIMAPLDKFYIALETRTQNIVTIAEEKSSLYGLLGILSVVLMVIAAGATLIFVRTRVIAALLKLKSSMVALSENNFLVEVPESNRRDEIGDMARTVDVFKNGLIENERFQSERLIPTSIE
jgi:methyl-accepting chemotaxis protein